MNPIHKMNADNGTDYFKIDFRIWNFIMLNNASDMENDHNDNENNNNNNARC